MLLSKGKVVKALDSWSTRFFLVSVSKGNVSESFQIWLYVHKAPTSNNTFNTFLEILGWVCCIKVAHMVWAQIPVDYILSFNMYLKAWNIWRFLCLIMFCYLGSRTFHQRYVIIDHFFLKTTPRIMIWGKTEEEKNSKRSKAFSFNPGSIMIEQYVKLFILWYFPWFWYI